MANPVPSRTSREWEFVNISDLGSASTQLEQQPGQLCLESEESHCLTAVKGEGLSTTQGTDIGQEVETAGKLPWLKCLTSLGLGNTYKEVS